MYGFVHGYTNRLAGFATLKECLKYARSECLRECERHPHSLGDVSIFRFPKNAIHQIYDPKAHAFTDYGMDCCVGIVWASNAYPPQYETNSANHSRTIMKDGSLGPIGWSAPPGMA